MIQAFFTFVLTAVVTLLGGAALALISTLFIYAGWNWGIAPAVPTLAHSIDLGTAFWLSLGLSAIGSKFQSTLKSS